MNKKLILFSHHKVDDFIINNFNKLKQLNPTWDIVPIGFEKYDLFPNSLIVNKEKYPTNHDIIHYSHISNVDWADPDFFIYDGYYQKQEYEEYFLYEYDTICNVSIEEFFDTNVDFFGNYINDPAPEDWWWIKLYRKHNSYNNNFNKLYAYGASTCIYFKKNILKKCYDEIIKNKHLYKNMLSEIRGGTLVKQFTSLKKGRFDINNFISWNYSNLNINLNQNYFYHPVKC